MFNAAIVWTLCTVIVLSFGVGVFDPVRAAYAGPAVAAGHLVASPPATMPGTETAKAEASEISPVEFAPAKAASVSGRSYPCKDSIVPCRVFTCASIVTCDAPLLSAPMHVVSFLSVAHADIPRALTLATADEPPRTVF